MTSTDQSIQILLASSNPTLIEATRSPFEKEQGLKLIDRQVTEQNISSIVAETHPDMILLDFSFKDQPFAFMEQISSEHPECALLVILPESELVNADRVVLSGARAFITYPYSFDNPVATITRVWELILRNQGRFGQQNANETPKQKNTWTVFSPKGGSGTSMVATNLAIAIHKTLKEDLLLIDGKHLFGHVALYLNLRTGNSIIDLISHAGQIDERLVRQVVVRHSSGISVLPSPNIITEGQGIRPDNLFKVVQTLQQYFPNIVIDAGNNLNDNAVTYMDLSDRVIVVLNPDLASIRDVRQFLEVTTTLSYPKEKMLLLLNQTGKRADVKKEQIEDILSIKIFGKISGDENQVLTSLNEGVPITIQKPRHVISREFFEISKELAKNLDLPGKESKKAPEKSKSGIFQRAEKAK